MIEDAELLRRYAADRSEGAFAELVRRRVNLVYSVALRQVGGDAHLAEDVTQRVFADLARKAAALCHRAVLSGWLYRSAQFAATDVVRSERRRRAREQEAETMNEISSDPDAPVDWEKFRPVLDEALGELADADRDAVALRFFEERSFAEIGAALRLSEEAARKRVSRALDEMQGVLARRGVTSTAVAVAAALASQVGVAAPAGLAASVTGAALAGTAAASAGWVAVFMSMSKLQTGLAVAFAAALTTGYFVQARANEDLRAEIAAQRTDQSMTLALRAENQRLAASVAEVEVLRRDDLEFQQLALRAAEIKKSFDEKARVASAASAGTGPQQLAQAQADMKARMALLQQEGNVLVEEFRALDEKAKDPTLSDEARAATREAAAQKMEAIKQKHSAVKFLAEHLRESGAPPEPGQSLELRRGAASVSSPP